MTSIPIIFFHYGNPEYLKYTLRQAKYFNPDSTVYLIGDEKNNRYPFVTHILASKYDTEAEAFTKLYRHRSPNDEKYELNCFLRWFYVRAFCKENGIESFIYLDSDVLVFQNFSEIIPLFKPCKIANTDATKGVPAVTYFNDHQTISDFCKYLIHAYSDNAAIAKLEEWYQQSVNDPTFLAGVSDMVLFQFFSDEHPGETLKIDLITDELAVDVTVNISDGYEMGGKTKKIYWKENLPYCKKLTTGELIRFATIHYQGDAKNMIRRDYKGNGYMIQRVWEPFKASYKKIKKTIKNR